MRSERNSKIQNQFAIRAGAAAIYLLVGLALGLIIAIASATFTLSGARLSFASIDFSTTGLTMILAAAFPISAIASISAIIHFALGFTTGALVPEAIAHPEAVATTIEKFLFWFGVAVGIGLLLLFLFTR